MKTTKNYCRLRLTGATGALCGLLLLSMPALAEPPFDGTIFIDPDIITEADSTAFESLIATGRGTRTMFDRRQNAFLIVNDVYLFEASFDDGLSFEIQVNPEFGSASAAMAQAEFYAPVIGRLPTALRADVQTIWIHQGDEPFGGGNNNLLIHTGQIAQSYITDGILEETLMHEAAHTSLDAMHAMSEGWLNAQNADPDFISSYARDFPTREDIAESFLPYFAVRFRSDRISEDLAAIIEQTIPNRIEYFDRLDLDMYPTDNAPTIVQTSVNDQFWIIGLGPMVDQTLIIEAGLSTSGGVFGIDFNPESVVNSPWGSIVIEFTSCTTAELSYAAMGSEDKSFGVGGYSLIRVAPNAGQRSCEADGFGVNPDASWAAGAWYGGATRAGEGILIDVLEGNQVFMAWFTYGFSG